MGKRKQQKSPAGGIVYYKKKGLTKSLIVHLSVGLHGDIKAIAEYEENSLQVIARRALQEYAQKRADHVRIMKERSRSS